MHISLPSLSFALSALSSVFGISSDPPEVAANSFVKPALRYEAISLEKRKLQVNEPGTPVLGAPPGGSKLPYVYGFLTPSPGATPVAITQQSQVVTTYIPQYTLCAGPPLAFISGTFINTMSIGPKYRNYSVSIPTDAPTCITEYSATPTTVCATVLQGIATEVTVTECSQTITFSSQYGYTLQTFTPTPTTDSTTNQTSLITPAPSIQTLTTYYQAPWQSLTTPGRAPTDVDVRVCRSFPQNATTVCEEVHELWQTHVETITIAYTTHIDITTSVPGPATFMVETMAIDITRTSTLVRVQTDVVVESEVETVVTRTVTPTTTTSSSAVRGDGAEETGVMSILPFPASAFPTVMQTLTRTLDSDDTIGAPLPTISGEMTSTTTRYTTTTVYEGTSTVTVSRNGLGY